MIHNKKKSSIEIIEYNMCLFWSVDLRFYGDKNSVKVKKKLYLAQKRLYKYSINVTIV